VDAISDVPAARWDASYYDPGSTGSATSDRFYCRRGGFVDALADFDPTRFGIMPVAVEGAEPDQLLALQVAADAIDDAGGEARLGDRRRVGVIVGRGGYLSPGIARLDQRVRTAHQLVASLRELVPGLGEDELDRVRVAFQDRLGPERPESSIGLVPNLAASRIANRLDLQGPAYTVDAACASSLLAVDQAVAELASGRCDTVIAGGVHHCHDVTLWSVFTQLGALSTSQRIRPFHRGADGILIGEGTGMVVLKRLADAERDGDRVYAVVRGTGIASDGRASTLMKPRPDGQALALDRAWQAAGLDPTAPGAIGLLEAHGTATPAGDATELAGLRQVFGDAGPEIGLGSVKSMIGHAMPAAGIAGLIKAALAVHHGVLPPTLHCDDPHPALAGTRFAPVTAARPWEATAPRRAGINAFGFGGINAHVVLEEAPGARSGGGALTASVGAARRSAPAGAPPTPERVLLLAGATPADLLRQLDGGGAALLDRDDTVGPDGPCRLAILCADERRLALARRVVEQGRPWRGRNDLWFTPTPLLGPHAARPGTVAFVFPGLEQSFEPRVDDVAAHFGLPYGGTGVAGGLGGFGLDVVAVGRLLDTALRRLGVTPDLVAGHSVGEWSAMIAAELYPRAAIEEFIAGFDPAAVEVPGVVFAALGCGADQAGAAIAGLADVVVSHDNCPHQSIICGDQGAVRIALDRLRDDGVQGQLLPFRSGFHSPMLAPYLEPIRATFARLPLQRPTVPVWSATSVAPYPDTADEVRELAVRHLVEPVRFQALIRRLHDSGVRAFVQVGTGSVTGFINDTLHDAEHLAIAANTAKRTGLDQLRRVAAALWAEGLTPDFTQLPRPRRKAGLVRLNLGAPLVSFGGSAPVLTQQQAPLADAGDPLMAEFDALLREANSAARDVLAARAPTRRTTTRELSLATMPFLADHCFYRQPAGWPDPTDRYPVVPMTTLLELMREAAEELAPGRTVVGFRDVRALRWLAVAPAVTVTISAALEGDRVTVTIDGYARGTVVLADSYPARPVVPDPPLAGERAAAIASDRMYADRWMFHGPAFQGVTELGPVADDGIRGELTTPAAPGALLDNAGQLMGLWIMLRVEDDRLAFPGAIDRIDLYGPHPKPGDRLACVVRIRSTGDTAVTADLELRAPDGRLWARLDGWQDRRFGTDARTWPVFQAAEENVIAEAQPGGWFLARERWRDTATRELIMRRYLDAAERAEYERHTPRGQRQWLLGRIAVKDAVRQWLWDRGHGPLFPIEITVRNDAAGRPLIAGPFDGPLSVSLAHTGALAVAIVGPGPGVGIDLEQIADRDAGFEATACTDAERALLDQLTAADPATRPGWLTRFWAAKEAVGKAEGTGLAGRPTSFVVERIEGDRLFVAAPGGRRHQVATRPHDSTHIVAWTSSAAERPVPAGRTEERIPDGH
jgi:acyl transferase domain-containing protein/phosphopantetheinyl transferase